MPNGRNDDTEDDTGTMREREETTTEGGTVIDADPARALHDDLAAVERAWRDADYAAAAAAMHRVVAHLPGDAAQRARLALCLDMAGDRTAAERDYRAALLLDPTCETAYAGLIQILMAKSDFWGAAAVCREQIRFCGETAEARLQLLTVLIAGGGTAAALDLVTAHNAAASLPTKADLHLESELAFRAGRIDQAIAAAERACRLLPDDLECRLRLAHFLYADRRFTALLPVLDRILESAPDEREALAMASNAHAEMGNYREAAAVAIRLVRMDPDQPRSWLFAATMLGALGQTRRAADLLGGAAARIPDDAGLLAARARLLADVGAYDEAVGLLDRAALLTPGDTEIRDLRLACLARRRDETLPVLGAATLPPLPRLDDGRRRRWAAAQAGGPAGLVEAARIKGRILAALVVRELSHRTAGSRLGMIGNIVEPVAQILFLGVVLSLFNNGRPPLGEDLFFFYATGVMPFYLFLHVINHSIHVIGESGALLDVPVIGLMDVFVGVALCELIIGAATASLVFAGFWIAGMTPPTDNAAQAVWAYLTTFLLAFGIGLTLAALNNLSRTIERTWQTVQRVLYVASGVFFLPQNMPDWVREPLSYNQLLQCIEWFRVGFFPLYDPPWLGRAYVVGSSLGLILLGTMLVFALRRRFRRL